MVNLGERKGVLIVQELGSMDGMTPSLVERLREGLGRDIERVEDLESAKGQFETGKFGVVVSGIMIPRSPEDLRLELVDQDGAENFARRVVSTGVPLIIMTTLHERVSSLMGSLTPPSEKFKVGRISVPCWGLDRKIKAQVRIMLE